MTEPLRVPRPRPAAPTEKPTLWRGPQPRRVPVSGLDVLALQRQAGNRAASAILRPPPRPPARAETGASTLQRVPGATTREGVSGAAETIADYFINAQTTVKRALMLRALLLNHDRAAELRAAYQTSWARTLDADLATLGGADALRALDSLDYGELRVMSKVLIALAGAGTDVATLFRVLRDANHCAPAGTGIGRFETMWQAVVGHLPAGLFDDFHSGTLADQLDDDLDGYELVKAHAVLAYGDLRPIDKIYLATVQAGTDEALLFEGLARCNPASVEADFTAYEFRGIALSDNATSIWDTLDSELSGEDYIRALALVDREPNPEYGVFFGSSEKTRRLGGNQRLVALVRAAVGGLGTNVDLIMSSIDEATEPERAVLKQQVEDPSDPLGLAGWFGDLGAAELSRLKAKLGVTESGGDAAGVVDPSTLADPTVVLLRGMGGVDLGTVFDTLKKSSGSIWLRFKQQYDANGAFTHYVDRNTLAVEKAHLLTIVFATDLDTRIHSCFGIFTDDEEYLFHLLEYFASNADRRRIVTDPGLMNLFRGSLSSAEMSKALILLKPTDLTPQENARWISQAVARERSGFFDFLTATGEALEDENRELQAGAQLGLLDASLSPEERALLEARSGRVEGALEAYTAARDEFANTASMIANVAVSVIIGALTGGAAGPALVAQLARAAAAMAVAKVLTEKVIRGDRFDIIGADGAVAFATGAVEGVMNVAGGLAAKNVLAGGLETVGLSAQAASGSLFRGAARTGLLTATEGGLAGGSTSFVDTLARDETWREGIITGLERVAGSTATGAATGAGMALSIHGALGGIRALRGAVNERLPLGHPDNPLPSLVLAGDQAAVRRLVDRLGQWETGIRDLQAGTGTGSALPAATREALVAKLVAHRQSIVEHVAGQFDGATNRAASTEPGSDVDLNLRGDNAGRNLIAAEQYLDSAYGDWRVKYRMSLLVDAGRIGSVEQVLADLPEAVKAQVRARVSQRTTALIFSRRLRFATDAERVAMLAEPPAGVDVAEAQRLSALGDGARTQLRNSALQRGDELAAELRAATDPTLRQQLAEQVTFQQMLANTMDDEAYLSGGGVKGFAVGRTLTNAFEQYEAVLDQIGMMAHAVDKAKGVLGAARSYELFKYINRICVVFEAAGVSDERLPFFKNWSEHVYQVDRDATGALDRPGGATPLRPGVDVGVPRTAPSDDFLLQNYQRFGEMVEQRGGELGRRTRGEPPAGDGPAAAGPGSSQLLRLPRPTTADGAAPGTSPALPSTLSGDGSALMTRLLGTRRTIEQEIGAQADFPAQRAAAQQVLDEVLAKPFRELTPADLRLSSQLQGRLFDAAGGAVERMKTMARTLLGGVQADVISIRKREDLAGFVAGILDKCDRKGYGRIAQMDDIIRGRLDIADGAAVERVAAAMRTQAQFPMAPGGAVAPG